VNNFFKRALWCALAVACAAYLCSPLVDPDLWWHITAGKWILGHRAIPRVAYWNLFAHGQPWRAYSWSFEAIVAWADLHFGVSGLLCCKFVLALSLAFSAAAVYFALSGNAALGALLGAYITIACFNHFTLRPQAVVWVLFLWVLLLAERYRERRTAGALAGLFIVMAIWANVHLTAVLAVASAAVWAMRAPYDRRGALAAGGAAFAGTFVTPYVGGEWLTFVSKAGHPFMYSSIAEFQPAAINQYATGFAVLLAAVLFLFLHFRPASAEVQRVVLAAAFLLGGLAVVKFLPFAMIMFAALVALIWKRDGEESGRLGNLGEAMSRLLALCSGPLARPAVGGLLAAALLLSAWTNVASAFRVGVNHEVVAVDEMDFIEWHQLPLPLLNAFGDGGYVMYRYSDARGEPLHLVPVDGRTNVTPPDILRAHGQAFSGWLNWREYVEAVKPETILWRTASPLTAILANSGEWCIVKRYPDVQSGHTVLVKRAFWELSRLSSENCGTDLARHPAA
jgi:hypothetical protein